MNHELSKANDKQEKIFAVHIIVTRFISSLLYVSTNLQIEILQIENLREKWGKDITA